MTFEPSGIIVIDGNSLTVARGDLNHYPNCTECANSLADWIPYALGIPPALAAIAVGAVATTTAQLAATAAQRVDVHFNPDAATKVCGIWEASNDLLLGASVEDALAHLAAYIAARKAVGWHVYTRTVIPRFIVEEANQSDNWFERKRLAFNTQLRARWCDLGADLLVEIAEREPYLQDECVFGPMYWSDHVHLSMDAARYNGKVDAIALQAAGLLH